MMVKKNNTERVWVMRNGVMWPGTAHGKVVVESPTYRPYLYFAYGSNLDVAQMLTRCATAREFRRYTLDDWRLVFRGVADIVPFKDCAVHGALYRITGQDEKALDRYEGYPSLYIKHWVNDPKHGPIMFYIMNGHRGCQRNLSMPGKGYLQTIKQGYKDWELSSKSLDRALSFTKTHATPEESLFADGDMFPPTDGKALDMDWTPHEPRG